MSTPPDPPPSLESLLSRPLRITIPDGRYFIGRFTCIDNKTNIVLSETEEFLPSPMTDLERRARDHREMYFPKSQRGAGEGDGWGKYACYTEEEVGRNVKEGRMLGLVLIRREDLVRVEVVDEGIQGGGDWKNGGDGVRGGRGVII